MFTADYVVILWIKTSRYKTASIIRPFFLLINKCFIILKITSSVRPPLYMINFSEILEGLILEVPLYILPRNKYRIFFKLGLSSFKPYVKCSSACTEAEVQFPLPAFILLQSPWARDLLYISQFSQMALKTGGPVSVHTSHCTHRKNSISLLEKLQAHVVGE